jgi:hypothetical protein
VVCLDSIFISDTHALAVLPNIASFTLDKELPGAFIIITCVATHAARDALLLLLSVRIYVELNDDVGMFSFCYN